MFTHLLKKQLWTSGILKVPLHYSPYYTSRNNGNNLIFTLASLSLSLCPPPHININIYKHIHIRKNMLAHTHMFIYKNMYAPIYLSYPLPRSSILSLTLYIYVWWEGGGSYLQVVEWSAGAAGGENRETESGEVRGGWLKCSAVYMYLVCTYRYRCSRVLPTYIHTYILCVHEPCMYVSMYVYI